jgi:autotransporter-associated beta strand protein
MKIINHSHRFPALLVPVAVALLSLAPMPVMLAESDTWQERPENNDWFNPENWTLGNVPNGLNDVAGFGASSITQLSANISKAFSLAEMNFAENAPPYTITIDIPVFATTIDGTGMINSSQNSQTIHLVNITRLSFVNNSSAGERMSYLVDTLSQMNFEDSATAGGAQITTENGTLAFGGSSNAGQAVITNSVGDQLPGTTTFSNSSNGGNATLIAMNGPILGGEIYFFAGEALGTSGGTCKVQVFGNGLLDISPVALANGGYDIVTIGSLSGDGQVFLGSANLTVGADGQNTLFSGTLQDGGAAGRTGGSLTKIGQGTLTLTNANSYTGGTTINDGVLLVRNRSGSATGTGAVQVNAGTLSGKGTIAGPVTIGSGTGAGAYFSPGNSSSAATVTTLQDTLTFKADGTYTNKVNTGKGRADKVNANGVTIESGAKFVLVVGGNKRLSPSTVFVAINNTSAEPIKGAFANLADGAVFSIRRNTYQVSYSGGDGNDLTLTVVNRDRDN